MNGKTDPKKVRTLKDMVGTQGFDPEGSGYDFKTASQHGIEPDKTGHWPSRVPETGRVLKGRKHPTFSKTVEADARLGYEVYRGKDGFYYSHPKKQK